MALRKRLLLFTHRQLAVVLAVCFWIFLSTGSQASDGSEDARSFIEGLSEQAIAALTPPGLSRSERRGRASC